MSFLGIHVDLNPTYGAYLIGTFISNILLGVTCLQTYTYFRTYKDGILVQATVASLLICELVHGALSMHVVYYYLISKFLSPLALLRNVWSINVLFGVTGTIVFIVHLSYATKIYYVSSKKLPIPIFIAVISLGNFVLGWILMAELFMHPIFQFIKGKPDDMGKAILISGAVIDIIIAGTLSFYLHRARTGMKQTDKIIDRLMIYTINNGILTSMFDIVSLIMVFAFPNDLYSLAISQVIGKLYSNSLMATFNARASHVGTAPASLEVSSYALSAFGAASNPAGQHGEASMGAIGSPLPSMKEKRRRSLNTPRSALGTDGSESV